MPQAMVTFGFWVILMRGLAWPKLRKQPEEHRGPKVAAVTPSTSRADASGPLCST